MSLTDFIMDYFREKGFEKVYETEDYQAAWEQRNAAEKELVEALTRKQRKLFHEYIRQRDALTAIELSHILEGCTMVISNDFFSTPRFQNPHS